jgi:hypothetical protein
LFRVPGLLKAWKAAPGIDIKLDGGYIVLPPSIHPSGALYSWAAGREPDRIAIPPLPAWCHRHPKKAAASAATDRRAVVNPENAGERYFIAAAARIRDRIMISEEGSRNNVLNTGAFAVGQLAHLTNKNLVWAIGCLIAAARTTGLDPREIERTIRSGFEAGMRSPRNIVFERKKGDRRE